MTVHLSLKDEEAKNLADFLKNTNEPSLKGIQQSLTEELEKKLLRTQKMDTVNNGTMSEEELRKLFTEDVFWKIFEDRKDSFAKDSYGFPPLTREAIEGLGVDNILNELFRKYEDNPHYKLCHPKKRTLEFLALRYGHDMSYKEIGEIYNLSVATIRDRCRWDRYDRPVKKLIYKMLYLNSEEYKRLCTEIHIDGKPNGMFKLCNANLSEHTREILCCLNINSLDNLLSYSETEFRDACDDSDTYEEVKKWMVDNGLTFESDTAIIDRMPIERCDFGTRTYNCLIRSGCNTIGDVKSKTEKQLSCVRNLGARSRKEIVNWLHENGLKLKDE